MNKKLLSILALVLMVCVLFVSCQEPAPEEPPHEHTFDTASWSSDATMHWHKATCEHTSEMKDVQGHIDANKDGICDVCAYAENHTHTFVEDWSYDATGHWHVANCFHDVKSEVVAHTADGMGFCTTCGYKVNDPDVSTVKKAVEMGIAQKKTVKGGTIVDAYGGITEFEYRNGYLYVCKGSDQYYYSVNSNGDIFAVYVSWGEATADPNATLDNLNGPAINLDFMDTCFGTEDLIETLYAMASVDNLNGDFAESVAEGVYSFSFGHYYGEYRCLYKVAVSFTLNETTYAFENVEITLNEYSYDSYTEVPGVGEAPSTYTVNEGAKPWVSTVTIDQGIDIKNPYDPVKLSPTDYSLSVEGEAVTDAITIMKGETVYVHFENVKPDGASMGFAVVELTGENVNVEWDINNPAASKNSLQAKYEPDWGTDFFTLSSQAAAGTTYTLKISVNGVVKTLTVTVAEPIPTEIVVGEFEDGYTGTTLTPTTEMTFQQGANAMVGAHLDVVSGGMIFTVDGTAVNAAVLGEFSVYHLAIDKYVDGFYLDLSELTVGTHTVTITSTANAELTATVTVTVTEAGSTGGEDDIPATGLGGTYLGTNTTPGIEPATITVVIDEAAGTVTYTFIHPRTGMEASVVYNYTVADGIVTLTQVDDNSPVFPMEACLFVDENGVAVFAGYNGYDYELTKQSGGDEGGNEGGAPTTLSGTFEGTSEYGTTIKVTIDEVSETVVFSYYDGRLGMEVEASFYFVLQNGAMQLLDDFGEPVMAMMASVELVDGVINSVTYNGTGYSNFVTVGGSGDEPAGVALQIGNNGIEGANVTYTYTATESGSLTLNIGVAIMGSVSVSYTVNGGDPVVLVTGEDSTVALSAGDEVEITVEASGYATLAASFTAGTTGGEGGEITPPPATGGDDLGDDEFAGAN